MLKKILILYSHDDEAWKDRLMTHINVLVKGGYDIDIEQVNTSRLNTAGDWFQEFEPTLDRAGIIVLLTSQGFLDSMPMQSDKVRKRLQMKQEGGFPIFILLANRCQWRRLSWMKKLPVFPDQEKYLSDLSSSAVDSTLQELTGQIADIFNLKSPVNEGILAYLLLNGVGPVKNLLFEPGPRLNIITGDNGLGKSFLLECAWWALSGKWAKDQILPGDDSKQDEEVEIRYQLLAKSGNRGDIITASYNRSTQQWSQGRESKDSPGLVVYARFDGTFAVWDPVKGTIPPPPGFSRPLSPLVFEKADIYNGIKEISESKKERSLCNGLLLDWVDWQKTPHSPFEVFTDILRELSTCSQEVLTPGKPKRTDIHDTRLLPQLDYIYGKVPLVHAASSVQRIISLAYFILWTWLEHKIACAETRKDPYKNMIVLIDEVECHLHPQWQRSIIPSLLQVKKYLDKELDIQFLITTHSPLVLASVEPVFDERTDKVFLFDILGKEIVLKEQEFLRQGRVDNWFTSELFGLRQARSREAEDAIESAKKLQCQANPAKQDIREVHERLTRYLSDVDTFWPRWTFFAEQHGVDV